MTPEEIQSHILIIMGLIERRDLAKAEQVLIRLNERLRGEIRDKAKPTHQEKNYAISKK